MFTWIFPLFFALSSARDDFSFIHSDAYDYCYLTKNITINLNYYQIVLLVDKDLQQTRAQTKYLKNCILQEHPTMIVDFHSLYLLKKLLKFPSYGSPRSTTFYMLLYHRDSSLNFQKVFENYTSLWSRSIRPKWLSIDLSYDKSPNVSKVKYKLPLALAWQHKFLDFTLVEIKGDNQTAIHTYNPFTDQFAAELFTDRTEIFPDKLLNMFKYPLKTMFVHEPPDLYLQQDELGNIIQINGTVYFIIETLAEILNFNLIIRPTLANDYVTDRKRTSFTQMNALVYNGTLDFGGNQFYVWGRDGTQKSYQLRPDGQCALVPLRPTEKVKIPKSFNLILGFSAIYILLMITVTRIMRFDRKLWNWLTMIRVLLGVTIPKVPFILKERILIGYIILLSFFYVSDFYSEMMDLKITTVNEKFKSYEQLDKSGLIPLVYPRNFNETFSRVNDTAMVNLYRKARLWNNPVSCAELLLQRNNTFFCILSENLAREMVSRFRRQEDGKPKLAIMRPCFTTTWKGYAFTPASPYVEKFDKILRLMGESGLLSIWGRRMRRPRKMIKIDDLEDKLSSKQLLYILGIGYLLAGGAFLLELAFQEWCYKVNNLLDSFITL